MSAFSNSSRGCATQERGAARPNLEKAAVDPGGIPLSFAQQRLWLLHHLARNSPLHNMPVVVRIEGRLDDVALEQALNAVVARHEALRTRICCRGENPRQEILENLPIDLRRIDFTNQRDAEEQASRLVRTEISRPFNL